ncbi:MAG: ergothioneine biosynthesis protein EgtB [Sphingobium sp.]
MPSAALRGEVSDTDALARAFIATRGLSLDLVATLSDADATVQSMPDASPAKWHLAHTTWFFETFILRDHVPGYRPHDERWHYLFNSYYEAEGPRHDRSRRGMLTRPTLDEVIDYRRRVDDAVLAAMPAVVERCPGLLLLGINHEQQHQELLLTDIKHLFFCNPLGPAAFPSAPAPAAGATAAPVQWHAGPVGLIEVGDAGGAFSFDNEAPAHRHYLYPHALAGRPVTNGEWAAFMADGGYDTAALWLSDGWTWIKDGAIDGPFYWRQAGNEWEEFTLSGWQAINPTAPVAHISLYEADAYARWAGARLPTEQEWEASAKAFDPAAGDQLDSAGPVAPKALASTERLCAMFGSVWEWTGSAYRPYPGFAPVEGAVGEYNGKFMSGQFVLRGGSCATPRGHVRASYRNFFHPHQRWQFSGLRLAKDL